MKLYIDYCMILLFLSCLGTAKKKQKLEIISLVCFTLSSVYISIPKWTLK